MKLKLKQTIFFLLGGSAVTLIIIVGGILWMGYDALPQHHGELRLSSLEHPVTVQRDEWGVPHIYAATEKDAITAMGYVVAQDRFFQMDFYRRLMQGRLAEILGQPALELDRLYRTLGIERMIQAEIDNLYASERDLIQAYCNGVNAFLENESLPIEHQLLFIDIEPWTVADVLLMPKMLAWGLTWWKTDVVLGKAQLLLDDEYLTDLIPHYPADAPPIITADDSLTRTQIEPVIPGANEIDGLWQLYREALQWKTPVNMATSNSWVVSGRKTRSGKPILANDPHLVLFLPAMVYEIHLSMPGFDIYGHTLPGAPAVPFGKNQVVSWGITNGMLDDIDLYIEKVNPDNPNEYLDGEIWVPFEIYHETIKIRGRKPEKLRVRISRHGPLITNEIDSSRYELSLCWMANRQGHEIYSLLQLNKALDWESFREALSEMKCPAQNFIYADTLGHIGYQYVGEIPIRRNGQGSFPRPAWSGEYDWVDYVPYEANPSIYNPAQDFIATANNLPMRHYPHHIANLWEPSTRVERINRFLAEHDTIGVDDMAALPSDVHSLMAEKIVPMIIAGYAPDEVEFYRELMLLGRWDYQLTASSEAATLYEFTYHQLMTNIFQDEMGDTLFQQFTKVWNYSNSVLDNLVQQETSVWFDDRHTPKKEDRSDIIKKSFEQAVGRFRHLNGADKQWGQQHTITFKHFLGDEIPFKWFLNWGPKPAGGDGKCVWKVEFPFTPPPYRAEIGPVLRRVDDLADIKHSLIVMAGGQSGHLFTTHYRDQGELWLAGAYRPAWQTDADVNENNESTLHLLP